MNQNWFYDAPCPHCGGTEFLEQSVQENVVKCDGNGNPEEFVPHHLIQTEVVWCRECDTELFRDEEV